MGERAIEPSPELAEFTHGMERIVPHVSDPMWESDAACSVTSMDLSKKITMHNRHFNAEQTALIEENCAQCPVRADCLASALEQEMAHGIYKAIRGGYLPSHRRRFIESIKKKGGIRRYMWEAVVEGRAPVRPQLPQQPTEETSPDLKLTA